jgi:hypothetical protein
MRKILREKINTRVRLEVRDVDKESVGMET